MSNATKSAQDGTTETKAPFSQAQEVALYSLVECAASSGAVSTPRRGRRDAYRAEDTV